MTNKHDEAQALLERCVNMLQAWHKGLPPKPAGFHFLMADIADLKKRRQQEIEQLALWNGKPVIIENHTGEPLQVRTVEGQNGASMHIDIEEKRNG